MRTQPYARRGILFSTAAHAAVLLVLLGTWRTARLAPMRLPGTRSGERRMLVYSTGGAPSSDSTMQARSAPARTLPRTRQGAITAPAVSQYRDPSAGPGGAGQSALGDGNITIALVKHHPRPAPDLSSLPYGTAGDVVLDATIDANGKITDLKLSKGLGASIDQTVIATVQGWTFTPATKDGVPIASEQEILFHFERS